jgi:hypothetical protein
MGQRKGANLERLKTETVEILLTVATNSDTGVFVPNMSPEVL